MSVGVVLPCAGLGKRMGTKEPKQYLLFKGLPVFIHTIKVFEIHPDIDEIVVVVREEEIQKVEDLVQDHGYKKVTHVVVGGETRQESVLSGLRYLTSDWVMVHDAVRPFVSDKEISALLSVVEQHRAAVLGVPVKNTIKSIHANGMIERTLDRSALREIYTPQAFSRELLLKAHLLFKDLTPSASDDAMLVEKLGHGVSFVEGSYRNMKLTTHEDMLIAETIYEKMCNEHDKDWARL